MAELQTKFGARIKELRKNKHLTQEQLAEKINISARSLRKIEMGECFASITTIEQLQKKLNIPITELFNFEHHKEKSDLKSEIIELLNLNSDKIIDIYKIVKAITSWG